MRKYTVIDWVCFILVVIGAINWGLVGFFDFNLVGMIFGAMPIVARIIYAVVGIAGVYMVYAAYKFHGHKE